MEAVAGLRNYLHAKIRRRPRYCFPFFHSPQDPAPVFYLG